MEKFYDGYEDDVKRYAEIFEIMKPLKEKRNELISQDKMEEARNIQIEIVKLSNERVKIGEKIEKNLSR